jgi:hypothetical protein
MFVTVKSLRAGLLSGVQWGHDGHAEGVNRAQIFTSTL